MKKAFVTMMTCVLLACSTFAATVNATTVQPSNDLTPNDWITQTGYFAPAETIESRVGWDVDCDYLVTDDGNVWTLNTDLPEGPCAVIFDTHGDSVRENDSIVAVFPLEVA